MWQQLIVFSGLVACVFGHGRVLKPPGRGTMWRDGYPTRPNYDDDGLNCGGLYHQWAVNGGKCGICGDSYDTPIPRPHELGGIYGEGIIVAHYLPGDILTATIDLTTCHQGFWEFKICPDPERNDQECFDEYLLELEDGGTKYYPNRGSSKYYVNYLLPSGLICDHCVLQWRYTAGNNWGDCNNGTQGLGCGNQEQFGACSDISIGATRSYDGNDLDGSEQMPIEFERFSVKSEQLGRGSELLGRVSEHLGRGSEHLGRGPAYLGRGSEYLGRVSEHLGRVSEHRSEQLGRGPEYLGRFLEQSPRGFEYLQYPLWQLLAAGRGYFDTQQGKDFEKRNSKK